MDKDMARVVTMAAEEVRMQRRGSSSKGLELAVRFRDSAERYADKVAKAEVTPRIYNRFYDELALRHAALFGGKAEVAVREANISLEDSHSGISANGHEDLYTQTGRFLGELAGLRYEIDPPERLVEPARVRERVAGVVAAAAELATTADNVAAAGPRREGTADKVVSTAVRISTALPKTEYARKDREPDLKLADALREVELDAVEADRWLLRDSPYDAPRTRHGEVGKAVAQPLISRKLGTHLAEVKLGVSGREVRDSEKRLTKELRRIDPDLAGLVEARLETATAGVPEREIDRRRHERYAEIRNPDRPPAPKDPAMSSETLVAATRAERPGQGARAGAWLRRHLKGRMSAGL